MNCNSQTESTIRHDSPWADDPTHVTLSDAWNALKARGVTYLTVSAEPNCILIIGEYPDHSTVEGVGPSLHAAILDLFYNL